MFLEKHQSLIRARFLHIYSFPFSVVNISQAANVFSYPHYLEDHLFLNNRIPELPNPPDFSYGSSVDSLWIIFYNSGKAKV